MKNYHRKNAGYTLIEVLTVVTMIGVLSSIGYGGLQGAIANSRTKDAAYNLAAYVEATANKARQYNDTLCVKKRSDTRLVTYRSSCASADQATAIDSLDLVHPVVLVEDPVSSLGEGNWLSAGADFVPRLGVSAIPLQGYFVARYGDRDLYAAAVKTKAKNSMVPKMGSDGSWDDL